MVGLTLIIIVFVLLIIAIVGLVCNKTRDAKKENKVHAISATVLVISFAIASLVYTFVPTLEYRNTINNDRVAVHVADKQKNVSLEDSTAYSIYYNEESDTYYVLKQNIFRFWDIFEKQEVSKDFVDTQANINK